MSCNTEANNKYMINYDKNKEYSFIEYLDANNLYGWTMFGKLPIDGFKWRKNMSKFNEDFIKNYNEDSDKGYVFEVHVEYPKRLHYLHSNLLFLPERIKINNAVSLYAICMIKITVVYIRSLKQTLGHGLILKKVHKIIKFNQKAWLKEYIDMNTELRKQAKNDFEKDFFKLINNSVFRETMENVRKYRYIKLLTTDKRRNQLVSELNYHTTK